MCCLVREFAPWLGVRSTVRGCGRNGRTQCRPLRDAGPKRSRLSSRPDQIGACQWFPGSAWPVQESGSFAGPFGRGALTLVTRVSGVYSPVLRGIGECVRNTRCGSLVCVASRAHVDSLLCETDAAFCAYTFERIHACLRQLADKVCHQTRRRPVGCVTLGIVHAMRHMSSSA